MEKGKVSKSLPVLDLTALRFQPLPATDEAVKGNLNHDAAGRFAPRMMFAPDTGASGMGGRGGGGEGSSAHMSAEEMAEFLGKNPGHPDSVAAGEWAVQHYQAINENPSGESSQRLLGVLRRIEPYSSQAPVWRGMSFKSEALRQAAIDQIKSAGFYHVPEIARSFSKDENVAREEFGKEFGLLLKVEEHHGMRDFEPVVKKLAPQFGHQKEVLAIHGQEFTFLAESVEEGTPVLHLAELGGKE
jgi:hypothetical protein